MKKLSQSIPRSSSLGVNLGSYQAITQTLKTEKDSVSGDVEQRRMSVSAELALQPNPGRYSSPDFNAMNFPRNQILPTNPLDMELDEDEQLPIVIEHEFAPLYRDDSGNLVRPPFINLDPRERYHLLQLKKSVEASEFLQSRLKYMVDPDETVSVVKPNNKAESSTQTHTKEFLDRSMNFKLLRKKLQSNSKRYKRSKAGRGFFSGEFHYDAAELQPTSLTDPKLSGYLGSISKPEFKNVAAPSEVVPLPDGDTRTAFRRRKSIGERAGLEEALRTGKTTDMTLDKEYLEKTERISNIIKVKELAGEKKLLVGPSSGFSFGINKESIGSIMQKRKEDDELVVKSSATPAFTFPGKLEETSGGKPSEKPLFGGNPLFGETKDDGESKKSGEKPLFGASSAPKFEFNSRKPATELTTPTTSTFSFAAAEKRDAPLSSLFDGKKDTSGEKKDSSSLFGEKKTVPKISFGGTKSSTPAFSFGKLDTEKEPTPAFTFDEGKETPTKTDAPLFGKSESKDSTTPAFIFGKPAATSSSSQKDEAPKFSFGKTQEAPKLFGETKEAEKAETPKFSFGEKNGAPKFSFGEKTDAPKLSFGEKTDAPKFSFGEKKDAPKFSFGEKSELPKINFGTPAEKTEPPALQLGKNKRLFADSENNELKKFSFGEKKDDAPKFSFGTTPAFSFGAQKAENSSGKEATPAFSFSSKETTPKLFDVGAAKQGLNFGQSEVSKSNSVPSFSLSKAKATTADAQPKPAFSFGQTSTVDPSSIFGGASQPAFNSAPKVGEGFSFNAGSTLSGASRSATPSTFGFGAPAGIAAPTPSNGAFGFNSNNGFGGDATPNVSSFGSPLPNPASVFGATNTGQPAPGFSFGGNNGAAPFASAPGSFGLASRENTPPVFGANPAFNNTAPGQLFTPPLAMNGRKIAQMRSRRRQ